MWNPKGRELFYRSGDKMMAVEITTQPVFAVGNLRVPLRKGGSTTFDFTPRRWASFLHSFLM